MLDDFFVRSVLAAVGIAIVAGPLGCFVVWRRMAYFGDAMAHAALLGVALALLVEINIMAGVFAVVILAALGLMVLKGRVNLPSDALLGILAHSTLALGLVLVGLMSWLRIDLLGYLFGDILSVSRADLLVILIGGCVVLALLAVIWKPLLTMTVSEELAAAEGNSPGKANFLFMVLLAGVIAIAMKIVGIILITSLLIIPAATARRFAKSPEQMAIIAAIIGAVSATSGLYGSLTWDTPAGPSIVVAALLIFLITLPYAMRRNVSASIARR